MVSRFQNNIMADEKLTDYEDVYWALEDISNTMTSGEQEVSINISFTETIPTNSSFERIVFDCKPDACINKRKTCKGCEHGGGAYKTLKVLSEIQSIKKENGSMFAVYHLKRVP